MDADLLVVGGGPVGLVAALHAARRGLSVVVAEPRATPVDKACGEGIMPAGVAELAGLGLAPVGQPLRGIRYVDARGRCAAAPLGPRPGLGVRRTVLHRALAEAVAEVVAEADGRAGGIRLEQATVTALDQGPGHVRAWLGRTPLTVGHVIAADGLHSPVRRMLGLDRPVRGERRYGLRRHVRVAPWTDHVEVHWAAGCEAYVTPVAPDEVGVAVLTRRRAPLEEQLAEIPWLVERLVEAEPVDDVRGAGPLRQRSTRRVAGRVLLVGDAAGYVDALTGEGLTVGWQQARAAVTAVAEGRPQEYERAWRRIGLAARLLTHGLVAATRHDVVRDHLVDVAGRAPLVYRGAVRVVAG
ncbi:NAD(P)/FAD-dependent oxidoreductase [Arsenicicoccus sp. oral taxon 190]|uniref:NAD(P)/FAD-dependent oxidoreductase n=1 Tax=Arsenicicoccus sp. oral taxon 190 TaxID=1658671 RepID=UPI00067A132C|nr:FAD-dependent monooxygenase [Arsenicicoccus sp. oral taxon 190]AKT51835.1 hypothetical protein ADJ73_12125 [Arsenicicoccus sp. oral taxon 190]